MYPKEITTFYLMSYTIQTKMQNQKIKTLPQAVHTFLDKEGLDAWEPLKRSK